MKTTATNETPARSIPRIEPLGDEDARPLWSVMIPTYEPGRYLRETLASLLAQAPDPSVMQIEVVDDCSVQDVGREVMEVGKGRVVFRRNATRLGLFGNWNACVAAARGEIVHLLHQDDMVCPGFYEAMARGLADNPDAGAAFCHHAYMDEKGIWRLLSRVESEVAGILLDSRQRFAAGVDVQCPAIVVRRAVYETLGAFDGALPYSADNDMWTRVAARYPIYYTPTILAVWRMHGESASRHFVESGQNIQDGFGLIDRATNYFPDLTEFLRVRKATMLGGVSYQIRADIRQGKFRIAWRKINRLRACDLRNKQTCKAIVKLCVLFGYGWLKRICSLGKGGQSDR